MKAQMQKGFTLIELMIVVAIIGILAAIALPAYQDYTARSQMSEAMTLASGARTAVSEYYSAKGVYPSDNESAGLADATDITGNYVAQVEVANGLITAEMKSTGVSEGIKGAELILSPTTTSGSVTWTCKTDGSTPTKYYPTSCRN
ncbi:pilin [Stutzerimonas nitrititolerans]|uniref:pilin n=1 Tax=Stutzerimonas nitrititolerans TaxID=2482751 RepID=UPI00289AB208|nr:pilin [Stutzerimonas nitrititolerans]